MKKTSSLKVGIPVGSVYVGAFASAAMVSGSYAVNYFLNHGLSGLWYMLAYAILMTFFFYCGFIHVKKVNDVRAGEGDEPVYDYSSLASAMYGKFSPFLMPIYELWQLIAMVLTGAVVVASGSTMLTQLLGLPTLISAVIMSVVIILVAIFGAAVVRASSTVMTILILALLLVLLIIVMSIRGDHIAELFRIGWKPDNDNTFLGGLLRLFMLACAGSVWSLGLGSVAQKIKTKKHCFAAAASAGVGGALLFVLSVGITIGYCPEALQESMPILKIATVYLKESMPWLPVLYYILMMLALISSGAPSLFVFSNRFMKLFSKRNLSKKRERIANIVLSIIFMVLCTSLSMFGLTTIVSTFFQYLGYIGIPLGIIPLIFVWPVLRRKGVYPRVYAGKATSGKSEP